MVRMREFVSGALFRMLMQSGLLPLLYLAAADLQRREHAAGMSMSVRVARITRLLPAAAALAVALALALITPGSPDARVLAVVAALAVILALASAASP